jgi:hypothetical protein
MITFQCNCGRTLAIDDKYAGRTGRCHYCGARVAIPAAGKRPAGSPSPHPSDDYAESPRAAPAASRRVTTIVCGALLLATAAAPFGPGGSAAWAPWRRVAEAAPNEQALMLAAWGLGLLAVVVGSALRGLVHAAARLVLGLGAGAALLLLAAGSQSLPEPYPVGVLVTRDYAMLALGAVCAAVISLSLRARLWQGAAVRVGQLLAGLVLLTVAGGPLVAAVRGIAGEVGTWGGLIKWVTFTGSIDRLAAALFMSLLAGSGAAGAWGALRRPAGASAPATSLVRGALLGIPLYVIGRLILTSQVRLAAAAAYWLVVVYALGVLFCAGASGLVAELAERRRLGGATGLTPVAPPP